MATRRVLNAHIDWQTCIGGISPNDLQLGSHRGNLTLDQVSKMLVHVDKRFQHVNYTTFLFRQFGSICNH